MQSKHTPGPWQFACTYAGGESGGIDGPDGNIIIRAQVLENTALKPTLHLIAAAPELLAALQAMLGCCYDTERDDGTIAAVRAAHAAIYKALEG